MPTQTQTTAMADPEQITPEWLYDTLMEVIEPELMIENMKALEEKYKNETPEDFKVRMERYQRAFEIFHECVEDIKADNASFVLDVQAGMNVLAAFSEANKEKQSIDDIEERLDSSDFRA